MPLDLWPPIGSIRRALAPAAGAEAAGSAEGPVRGGQTNADADAGTAIALASAGAPAHVPGHADRPPSPCASADLLLPLAELARRRAALAARAFPAHWAPGRLVGVRHDGLLHGVLLARALADEHWQGWLAASEADWAGPYDVLLEPDDDPFEPQFGVIQVWNPVILRTPRPDTVRVLGELSATRLAALHALQDEAQAQQASPIVPAPGRIALRSVAGTFDVLCGTPLAASDPRAEYQAIYRAAAARLSVMPLARDGAHACAALPDLQDAAPRPPAAPSTRDAAAGPAPRASPSSAGPAGSGPSPSSSPRLPGGGGTGPLARLRRWFGAEPWLRPAFALLALVVVLQNTGRWAPGAPEEEAVRFRDLSGGPRAAFDVVVTWKRGVSVADSALLLRELSASVVAGPDAQGRWYLRLPDAQRSAALLRASPLVGTVALP